MTLLILLTVWAALFAWMAFSCWRAPIGYEDRAGFHFGSIAGRDTSPQRRRARGCTPRRIERGRHLPA